MADDGPQTRLFAPWAAAEAEAEGSWAENRRLAAAVREVIERLVRIDAPAEELRAAAEALERYAERLRAHPRQSPPPGSSGEARPDALRDGRRR